MILESRYRRKTWRVHLWTSWQRCFCHPKSNRIASLTLCIFVEVFKEEPGLRTAWYSANVLSLEDDKAYVLFNDLSVEQGTDKLKEWVALKGKGDQAPKIRTARSVTAMPYEGTRKRRRAVIGDHVFNSDKPVALFPPCKQENFVPQIYYSLVKLQAWCYS